MAAYQPAVHYLFELQKNALFPMNIYFRPKPNGSPDYGFSVDTLRSANPPTVRVVNASLPSGYQTVNRSDLTPDQVLYDYSVSMPRPMYSAN